MRNLLSEFDEYLRLDERCTFETVKRFCAIARQFTEYLLGRLTSSNKRLVSATTSDVVAFLRQASETRAGTFSAHKWNQRLTAVRALFRYLVKEKLCPENPTAELHRQTAICRERIPLSLAEFVMLIRAMRTADEPYRSRNIALVQIGFHCGLRLSELARLNLDHLDRSHRLIVNLEAKGGKFLVVPFPPIVLKEVDRYLEQRARFHPVPGEKALFLSERRRRLSGRQIGMIVPEFAAKAGILRRISPHFLRHSVATAHARRGTQPWDVQRLLGHASLATTELYIHTLDSLAEAVDALGAEVESMLADSEPSQAPIPQSAAMESGLMPSAGSYPPAGQGQTALPSCGTEVIA